MSSYIRLDKRSTFQILAIDLEFKTAGQQLLVEQTEQQGSRTPLVRGDGSIAGLPAYRNDAWKLLGLASLVICITIAAKELLGAQTCSCDTSVAF